MKNEFPAAHADSSTDENITAAWQAAHPHLMPYRDTDSTSGKISSVFARLHFASGPWVDMAEVHFDRAAQQFFLTQESRRKIEMETPAIKGLPVDAVDARLWFQQPTIINIEPTTRCNFSCWYCIGRHMVQDDITLENFGKMLDNFPSVKVIALVGEGEPLLHKDFFTMAGMAKDRGIRVMIISNGSAFSQSVIRQLCETEIAYVSISIDSHVPETFAESRLEGNLDKVWQGIRRLREYRDANGFKFPKIALKGTLFEATQDQLPAIVDAAKANGVEIFESFQALNPKESYVRIYPAGQARELPVASTVQQAINRDSLYGRTQLQAFQDFCTEENLDFFPTLQSPPSRRNCSETWIYSLLSGDVTPCCQIKTPPSQNWNIFERSLDEVISDPDYENMRFNLWNGIFPRYCEGCWKTRP